MVLMTEGLTCFKVDISNYFHSWPPLEYISESYIKNLILDKPGLTAKESSGDQSEVAPPVPIPNTAVKRLSADDTGGATPCGKYAIARSLFLSSYEGC